MNKAFRRIYADTIRTSIAAVETGERDAELTCKLTHMFNF